MHHRLALAPLVRALFLALPLGLLAGCAPEPGGLVVVGEVQDPARPYYHDFGEVAPGTPLEKVFTLENREGRPVRVLKVDTSCACTVPSLRAVSREGGVERVVKGDPFDPVTKLVIPPGAVAEVTLRVDAEAVRKPNVDKLVTVRVTTDSPRTPYLGFEAHLVVIEHFQVTPSTVDFGRVPTSTGAVVELGVVPLDGSERRLGAVLAQPEGVQATVAPHPAALDRGWLVDVRLDAGRAPGVVKGELELEVLDVDGSPAAPLEIPVRGLVVPDIGLSPPMFSLRAEGDEIAHEIVVRSWDGRRRFLVEEVRVLGEWAGLLEASATPELPDASGRSPRWTVRLVGAPVDAAGELPSGSVVVTLDDDEQPRLEVPISTVNLR